MIIKQILGVHRKTSNIAVLLELGRVPLNLYAIKLAIKNWERIKSGNANVLTSKSYEDALTKDLLWIRNIKNLLEQNGLNIEKGRHNNIPRDLRYCPFCPTRVETEIHFLLECNAYVDERKQLLESLPSIKYIPSLPKRFTYIFSKLSALNIATFISEIFEKRAQLLVN